MQEIGMARKITLGTVQFGMDYGIANNTGQIEKAEIIKILSYARHIGITTLDTAINYGSCETILGQIGVSNWKIVTKLPITPEDISDRHKWVRRQVEQSLLRLGVTSIYGVLFHAPLQLLTSAGQELASELQSLREEGIIKKIGVSIYNPDHLEQLFDVCEINLVQAPLNFLNQRIHSSGWADRLIRNGVELHVRSLFLQGLLLMKPQYRPKQFAQWSSVWHVWDSWCVSMNINPLEACLRLPITVLPDAKMVVGIDKLEHLQEIVNIPNKPLTALPDFSAFNVNDLIDPSCWSKL